MRNRIMSALLAVVMVVSMAALFTLGSSADAATYTLTLSSVDIVAGQTAYVDVILTATNMDSDLHIREWQITLSEGVTASEADSTFYGNTGTVYSFINEDDNIVGASVSKRGNLGTSEQLNGDGFKLATLALTAAETTTVTATVEVLTTEASDFATRENVVASTTFVAGTITLYIAKALPEAIVDGHNVYFVGRIAAAIAPDYQKVGLLIDFGGGKTFTNCTKTSVAKTIIGVASTNETTASQQEILFVEGGDLVLLTSAVVKGVPAGTYNVTVSVLLDDGTGAQAVGETTAITVVVED